MYLSIILSVAETPLEHDLRALGRNAGMETGTEVRLRQKTTVD
jgi:hypothetical protein